MMIPGRVSAGTQRRPPKCRTRMRWTAGFVATVLVVVAFGLQADAAFNVSSIFTSNMVLQHDEPVVWGFGDPGTTITTSLVRSNSSGPNSRTSTSTAQVGPNGIWKQKLDAIKPSMDSYDLVFSDDKNTTVIKMTDVLFGLVFLCSGQSNMVMNAGQTDEIYTGEELANDAIRMVQVGNTVWRGTAKSPTPRREIAKDTFYTFTAATNDSAGWTHATQGAVMGTAPWTSFSAVCFSMGTTIYAEMRRRDPTVKVPIGLISAAVSGSAIQAWSSPSALSACSQPRVPTYEEVPDEFGASVLYYGLIEPLLIGPLSVSAVAFYQGESNAEAGLEHAGDYYQCQFPATITEWIRRLTRQAGSPWLGYVQLSPFVAQNAWAAPVLRESQRSVLSRLQSALGGRGSKSVSMVSAVDLGDPESKWSNIHSRKKRAIGQRLAWAWLTDTQGVASPHSYPVYRDSCYLSSDPGSVVVSLANVSPATNSASYEITVDETAKCPAAIDLSACGGLQADVGSGFKKVVGKALPDNVLPGALLMQSGAAKGAGFSTRYAYAPWSVAELFSSEALPVLPWPATPVSKACDPALETKVLAWVKDNSFAMPTRTATATQTGLTMFTASTTPPMSTSRVPSSAQALYGFVRVSSVVVTLTTALVFIKILLW